MIRSKRFDSELSPTVRVAVGDFHLPFMTLLRVEDEYFVCLHEKRALPDPRKIKGNKSGFLYRKDLQYRLITSKVFESIQEAIKKHEVIQGYHINPHTFIYTWCLKDGFDLYEEGILTL